MRWLYMVVRGEDNGDGWKGLSMTFVSLLPICKPLCLAAWLGFYPRRCSNQAVNAWCTIRVFQLMIIADTWYTTVFQSQRKFLHVATFGFKAESVMSGMPLKPIRLLNIFVVDVNKLHYRLTNRTPYTAIFHPQWSIQTQLRISLNSVTN